VDTSSLNSPGIEVLRYIRETADSYVPLVAVVNGPDPSHGIADLRAGADDFVARPVDAVLLKDRIDALMRRALEDSETVQVGDYRIDRARRSISRSDVSVSLTDKEFQLADLLLSNLDTVLTRQYLLGAVWGSDRDAQTRTVDTHASRVRHKLGLSRRGELWLRPVYGKGYEIIRQKRPYGIRTSTLGSQSRITYEPDTCNA
jgi:DNA-binding response OmpR family regulator